MKTDAAVIAKVRKHLSHRRQQRRNLFQNGFGIPDDDWNYLPKLSHAALSKRVIVKRSPGHVNVPPIPIAIAQTIYATALGEPGGKAPRTTHEIALALARSAHPNCPTPAATATATAHPVANPNLTQPMPLHPIVVQMNTLAHNTTPHQPDLALAELHHRKAQAAIRARAQHAALQADRARQDNLAQAAILQAQLTQQAQQAQRTAALQKARAQEDIRQQTARVAAQLEQTQATIRAQNEQDVLRAHSTQAAKQRENQYAAMQMQRQSRQAALHLKAQNSAHRYAVEMAACALAAQRRARVAPPIAPRLAPQPMTYTAPHLVPPPALSGQSVPVVVQQATSASTVQGVHSDVAVPGSRSGTDAGQGSVNNSGDARGPAEQEDLAAKMMEFIAELTLDDNIEDVLMDLAMRNDTNIQRLYRVFRSNPVKFTRHASRLAQKHQND